MHEGKKKKEQNGHSKEPPVFDPDLESMIRQDYHIQAIMKPKMVALQFLGTEKIPPNYYKNTLVLLYPIIP